MKIKLSFLLCLTSMFLLSACGNGDENNSSLFSNYSSEVLETYCAVKGAVQTKNSDTDLVYIECSQNIDTSMEYSFNPQQRRHKNLLSFAGRNRLSAGRHLRRERFFS